MNMPRLPCSATRALGYLHSLRSEKRAGARYLLMRTRTLRRHAGTECDRTVTFADRYRVGINDIGRVMSARARSSKAQTPSLGAPGSATRIRPLGPELGAVSAAMGKITRALGSAWLASEPARHSNTQPASWSLFVRRRWQTESTYTGHG